MDLSKCIGENCPIKEKCYRHIGPSGLQQSWHSYKYVEGEGCSDFIDKPVKTK